MQQSYGRVENPGGARRSTVGGTFALAGVATAATSLAAVLGLAALPVVGSAIAPALHVGRAAVVAAPSPAEPAARPVIGASADDAAAQAVAAVVRGAAIELPAAPAQPARTSGSRRPARRPAPHQAAAPVPAPRPLVRVGAGHLLTPVPPPGRTGRPVPAPVGGGGESDHHHAHGGHPATGTGDGHGRGHTGHTRHKGHGTGHDGHGKHHEGHGKGHDGHGKHHEGHRKHHEGHGKGHHTGWPPRPERVPVRGQVHLGPGGSLPTGKGPIVAAGDPRGGQVGRQSAVSRGGSGGARIASAGRYRLGLGWQRAATAARASFRKLSATAQSSDVGGAAVTGAEPDSSPTAVL